MIERDRLEPLRGRVEALGGRGKAAELPPQVIGINVLIPVPALAGTSRTGKERSEQDVVEDDPVPVLRVKLQRSAVARL